MTTTNSYTQDVSFRPKACTRILEGGELVSNQLTEIRRQQSEDAFITAVEMWDEESQTPVRKRKPDLSTPLTRSRSLLANAFTDTDQSIKSPLIAALKAFTAQTMATTSFWNILYRMGNNNALSANNLGHASATFTKSAAEEQSRATKAEQMVSGVMGAAQGLAAVGSVGYTAVKGGAKSLDTLKNGKKDVNNNTDAARAAPQTAQPAPASGQSGAPAPTVEGGITPQVEATRGAKAKAWFEGAFGDFSKTAGENKEVLGMATGFATGASELNKAKQYGDKAHAEAMEGTHNASAKAQDAERELASQQTSQTLDQAGTADRTLATTLDNLVKLAENEKDIARSMLNPA